jgi:hypothetical protein
VLNCVATILSGRCRSIQSDHAAGRYQNQVARGQSPCVKLDARARIGEERVKTIRELDQDFRKAEVSFVLTHII